MQRRLLLWAALLLLFSAPALSGAKPTPGRIEVFRFKSAVFKNTRLVHVWLPPEYEEPAHVSDRYPVLYMNDGQFALHNPPPTGRRGDWRADETAAKLMANGKIEPVIIVAIDNGGSERAREYLPVMDEYYQPPLGEVHGEHYPEMLFDELMPLINERFRTRTDANGTALCGSSYGAVAALYTVVARPGKIGRLLLESPSLYVGNEWLLEKAKKVEDWPGRIYVGIGTAEMPGDKDGSQEAVSDVLRLEEIIRAAGVAKSRIKINVEQGATHNDEAWAGRFATALTFLFAKAKPEH